LARRRKKELKADANRKEDKKWKPEPSRDEIRKERRKEHLAGIGYLRSLGKIIEPRGGTRGVIGGLVLNIYHE